MYVRSYGYSNIGWYVPTYLAYPYTDYDDEDDSVYGAPQESYVVSAPEPEPADAGRADGQTYAPNNPWVSEAAPAPEDAVTLVFKDGRPNERIRNYIMTATTLTVVQGHRMHEVAIADLDLAATERANRNAGVSFQLPAGN